MPVGDSATSTVVDSRQTICRATSIVQVHTSYLGTSTTYYVPRPPLLCPPLASLSRTRPAVSTAPPGGAKLRGHIHACVGLGVHSPTLAHRPSTTATRVSTAPGHIFLTACVYRVRRLLDLPLACQGASLCGMEGLSTNSYQCRHPRRAQPA